MFLLFHSYSLVGTDAPFSVNETTGEVYNTDTLDREITPSYILTVVAHDGHPSLPLSSSATVVVMVEDVNDHAPQFLHGPYVSDVPAKLNKGEKHPPCSY